MRDIKILISMSIVGVALAVGCGSQSENSDAQAAANQGTVLIIEPHKERCNRTSEDLCFMIKRPNETRSRVFLGELTGFQYEWGRRYTVEVTKESEGIYRVTSLMGTTQESYSSGFMIRLAGRDVRALENCQFAIGSEVKFSTASPRLCRQIRSLSSRTQKLFEFSFTGSAVLPLRVESLGPANGEHRE